MDENPFQHAQQLVNKAAVQILTQNVNSCYSGPMTEQDPVKERKMGALEWRHGLEQLAIETGAKHAEHVNDVAASRQFIVEELMPKAAEAGIPFDTLANLLGLSRQTLYRWRDIKQGRKENR